MIFSDTRQLSGLLEERDYVLNHLETAEAIYIASFRAGERQASDPSSPPTQEDGDSEEKSKAKGSTKARYHFYQDMMPIIHEFLIFLEHLRFFIELKF